MAEHGEDLAVGAEMDDRVNMGIAAGAAGAAPFGDPERAAVAVNFDGTGAAQEAALWHGVPGLVHNIRIGQRLVEVGAARDIVVAGLAAVAAARRPLDDLLGAQRRHRRVQGRRPRRHLVGLGLGEACRQRQDRRHGGACQQQLDGTA
jgi:hypothetical protein